MLPIYKLTRLFPVKVGIAGIRRDLPLKMIELFLPLKENIMDLPDGIKIYSGHRNQKLLFYYFYNVLRYYKHSPLFRYIEKTLKPDHIFVDIGANLGFYSYLTKKFCKCEVFVFEPEPNHNEYLNRNNHLFDRIFKIAISDNTGETDFYVGDDDNLGGSSLVMGARGMQDSKYSHLIKIKTQRLDNMGFEDSILDRIKLVKIDVEGAEASVIKGMEGLLARYNFDIWCEVRGDNSDRNPGSYKVTIDLLNRFGYQPFIYNGKKIQKFSPKHIKQVFDILFIKNK